MSNQQADIVVAGHICLDIIPVMQANASKGFVPGSLVEVGRAMNATGGAVANTGVALARLGNHVQLMGKVGDDYFGEMIIRLLEQSGAALSSGMIVAEGEHSSYSIVISPPETDRVFLHHTGTNDTFSNEDVVVEKLAGARLFHFGYPPLMRQMYENDGEQLIQLFQKVKQAGLTTSLDLAKPDPNSNAGRSDWDMILQKVLPYTDLFLPSFEEILYMLDRTTYDALVAQYGESLLDSIDNELLTYLSDRLLHYGAAIVAIKLGEHGLYLRTTSSWARLQAMGSCAPQSANWLNRELLTTCYQVNVAGTTGAGDCTIAGILTTIMQGKEPHEVLLGAVAVGACNVERQDATSGVPLWEQVEARMAAGWQLQRQQLQLAGWSWDPVLSVWRSGRDGGIGV